MLEKLRKKKLIGFIIEVVEGMSENNISGLSAQGAYYIMVSLVPLIVLILSIIKLTPLDASLVQELLVGAIPTYFREFVEEIINQVFSNSRLVFSVSILVLLWSASKGIYVLSDGLNKISNGKARANFILDILISLMYTCFIIIGIPVLLLVTVFSGAILDKVIEFVPRLEDFLPSIEIIRLGMSTVLVFILLAVVYKFIPNVKVKFKEIYIGALVATIVWQIFTYIFGIYISYALKNANIYGSLSVILFLMLWFYCIMFIIFVGNQINVILNKRLLENKIKK